MKINFELISKAKFEDSIKINNKLLFRAQKYPDWNTTNNTVEYRFYDAWNKRNLLPKPTHKVILYIHIKSNKKSDGWTNNKIERYQKGIIINLTTKQEEIIESIEK